MSVLASALMTKPVMPQATLAEIAGLLAGKGISAVRVCNSDGLLAGIVTEAEVLAEGEDLAPEFLDDIRRDHRIAAEIMTRHVITAGEQATVPELAELMVQHAVKRIPILRSNRVVGIVSRADMIRALARAPAMLV